MASSRVSFGAYTFDPDTRQLSSGGSVLPLGSRAQAILAHLIEAEGALVPSSDLVARVWGGRKVDAANLRIHIASLREILGTDSRGIDYVQNVPGRGYCLAAEIRRVAEPAPAPRPSGLSPTVAAGALVGRDEDLAALTAKLRSRHFVTLVGPGGIGKTTLAKAVMDVARDEHPDGAIFVDLAAVRSADDLLQAIGAVVLPPDAESATVQRIAAALADRRQLLVVDTCEGVADEMASFGELIRRAAPGIDLLCTSREALRAEGEWLFRLQPLTVPEADVVPTVDDIARFPALDLFLQRSRAATADVALDPAALADAAAVCRALDGIPLALELAAATVGVFGIGDLKDRLADRFALLTRGRRTAVPRHRTLRAMLDHSYDLLSADEQALLRSLGLLSGAFSLSAVAALSPFGPDRTESLFAGLEAKSLVVRDDGSAGASFGPPPRFRMLETTALYAREKLAADPAIETVLQRHVALVRSRLAETQADPAPLPPAVRRGLQDNVATALDAAFARASTEATAVALTAAAVGFWLRNAILVGHRPAIERALERIGGTPLAGTEQDLDLRTAVGLAEYYENGPTATSIALLRGAHTLAEAIGEQERRLDVHWMIFGITGNSGDYHAEADLAASYATVLGGTETSAARFRGHRMTGRALHDLGRHGEAEVAIVKGLAAERDRDRAARFTAYHNDHWTASKSTLARLQFVTGRIGEALATADDCLEEALHLDHAQSLCWALAFNLAPIAIWCGDLDRAERDVGLLLHHSRRTFQHWHEWGQRYAMVLRLLRSGSEADALRIPTTTAAEADLFATFHPVFLRHDPQVRVDRGRLDWCTAEHLRAAAARSPDGTADLAARFQAALALADRQGAFAFSLRAATSLAGVLRRDGRAADAASTLRATLAPIRGGAGTADHRAAEALLRDLDRQSAPTAPTAPIAPAP